MRWDLSLGRDGWVVEVVERLNVKEALAVADAIFLFLPFFNGLEKASVFLSISWFLSS